MHCSRKPQISFFSNFFIKKWSHSIIHTFKNYFITIFFSFQFPTISKQTLTFKILYSGEYEEISSGLGVKYSAFHFLRPGWIYLYSVWPNKQSIILCLYEMHMLKSFESFNPRKKKKKNKPPLSLYIGWWCHYNIHTVMMTDLAQLNSIKGICGRVFVYYNTLKSQYIYIYIWEH